MTLRKIAISEAKRLAKVAEADAVVILSFGASGIGGTSYAKTKQQCRLAGEWMDNLIDSIMRQHTEAARVNFVEFSKDEKT
jgi:hypothetical protein